MGGLTGREAGVGNDAWLVRDDWSSGLAKKGHVRDEGSRS